MKKWSRWIHRGGGFRGCMFCASCSTIIVVVTRCKRGRRESVRRGANSTPSALTRSLFWCWWSGWRCFRWYWWFWSSQRSLSGGLGLNSFLQGDSPVNHCLPGQGTPPSQGKIPFWYSSLWDFILKILTVSRRVPNEPPLSNRSLRNQHGQQLQEECCKG